MARPTHAAQFVRFVREAGGSIVNGQLRKQLGLDEDKYWKVHQELLDKGLITKGRGRGGSVILVVPEGDEAVEQVAQALPRDRSVAEEFIAAVKEASAQPEIRELDLYNPALEELRKHWKNRNQLLHCVCEKTALQGRRETGGSWSRPDLVAVGLRKFEYLPDKVLEVYTFEIKAAYDVSIKGVLEALAHREFATRAYVIYHTNGEAWDGYAEAQRIEELGARHGIGVIVATNITSMEDCWEVRVSAARSGSDPEKIEQFIKLTLSEDSKSQIRKWL